MNEGRPLSEQQKMEIAKLEKLRQTFIDNVPTYDTEDLYDVQQIVQTEIMDRIQESTDLTRRIAGRLQRIESHPMMQSHIGDEVPDDLVLVWDEPEEEDEEG